MQPINLIFPGQGSFFPGIGKNLYEKYHAAKEIFSVFTQVINNDITQYCFGDKAILTRADNQWIQLTISCVNLASAYVLESQGIQTNLCLGHSLGEVSALIFSEAVTLEDGVRLVQKRGELMEKYSGWQPGDMLSVVGLSENELEQILADINIKNNYNLAIANKNAPGLNTVCGLKTELPALREYLSLKNLKGVMVKMLDVGGAWHHPTLMKGAVEEFSVFLSEISFKKPRKKFYSVTYLDYLDDPDLIRESVGNQLKLAVNWSLSIQKIANDGITDYIEAGQSKVLKSIIRKISAQITCSSIIDVLR
jgi:[acyl-carrier-protein] S-malonyltransferase